MRVGRDLKHCHSVLMIKGLLGGRSSFGIDVEAQPLGFNPNPFSLGGELFPTFSFFLPAEYCTYGMPRDVL